MIYILLILIGIILIFLNREVFDEVRENENSFYNTIKRKDEKFTDYDMELIAIRKDMAESILDLQQEIAEVRNGLVNNQTYKENLHNDIKIYNKEDDIKKNYGDDDIISEINFNNATFENNKKNNEKVEEIKIMIEQGKNDEEICNSLNIGKGEVLLIRGLFK